MKSFLRRGTLFFFAALLGTGIAFAAGEDKTVEFHGTVSALDLAANTITVRSREKDYVFQIDPQRCAIVKDGGTPSPGAPAPGLGSAQIGDTVVGILVVERAKPVVTQLYLTTKPETGVRVKEKPGFITSPYHPSGEAMDVRGYRRGSLLVDKAKGKIFLVP